MEHGALQFLFQSSEVKKMSFFGRAELTHSRSKLDSDSVRCGHNPWCVPFPMVKQLPDPGTRGSSRVQGCNNYLPPPFLF